MMQVTEVYCDGGIIPDPRVANKNPSNIGGTWSWCHVAEVQPNVKSIIDVKWGGVLTPHQSMHFFPTLQYVNLESVENNIMELIAAIKCLQALPEGWSGKFYSDSQNAIGWLFGIEGKLFSMKNLPERLVILAQEARYNVGDVEAILLQGHPSQKELALGVGKSGRPVSKYNVLCDERCTMIAHSYLELWNLPVVKQYTVRPSSNQRVVPPIPKG